MFMSMSMSMLRASRILFSVIFSVICVLWGASSVGAAERPDEGGLHHQDWFARSFLVLSEDLHEARSSGKRLVLVWEQKGCEYCERMHEVYFADPEFTSWIAERFYVVQMDLRGNRLVTDFDGTVMEEKQLARKYHVTLTPTVQFLSNDVEQVMAQGGAKAEVARMPGLLPQSTFRAFFEYVDQGGYETYPSFRQYFMAR